MPQTNSEGRPVSGSGCVFAVTCLCTLLALSLVVSAKSQALMQPSHSVDPSCPVSVYFGNGMDTLEVDAYATANFILGPELDEYLSQHSLPVVPARCIDYAWTADTGKWDGIIESAASIVDQDFSSFWGMLSGTQPPTAEFGSWLEGKYQSNIESTYQANPDVQSVVAQYRSQLQFSAQRVVIVAHSQGNLTANEAYLAMSSGADGKAAISPGQIIIVSVATPASFVATGDNHTTYYGDAILIAPGRLNANTDISGNNQCSIDPRLGRQLPGPGGSACHSFDKSYLLAGTAGRASILAHLADAIPTTAFDRLTAHFTMTSGTDSATDGQTLIAHVDSNSAARLDLSSIGSFDPYATISGWAWTIDGMSFSGSTAAATLGIGTHRVSLVVADGLRTSAAATGTFTVSPSVGQVPAGPSSVSARPLSPSSIRITWIDSSDDEDGFRIDRCSNALCSTFSSFDVPANIGTFDDVDLPSGETFWYRVKSFNSAGAALGSSTLVTQSDASTVLTRDGFSADLGRIAGELGHVSFYFQKASLSDSGYCFLLQPYDDAEYMQPNSAWISHCEGLPTADMTLINIDAQGTWGPIFSSLDPALYYRISIGCDIPCSQSTTRGTSAGLLYYRLESQGSIVSATTFAASSVRESVLGTTRRKEIGVQFSTIPRSVSGVR